MPAKTVTSYTLDARSSNLDLPYNKPSNVESVPGQEVDDTGEKNAKLTEICPSNARSIAFLWTFCAAVSKPDSGVHSSGVRTTPWTISIPLRPAFFASAWRSLRISSCTAGEEQRRWRSDSGSGRCDSFPFPFPFLEHADDEDDDDGGCGVDEDDDDDEEEDDDAARMADFKLAACGKMITMGCFACDVACTQRLETSEEVRYVTSNCSRATY